MDRGESTWLSRPAEFDLAQGWVADGQLGCAQWMMWRTGIARATAYEKLRIAHQLRRGSVLAAAFEDGRISYSAVWVICRIDEPDAEVDEALVELAEAGTVEDVERMVRVWQAHAGQRRPPVDHQSSRGLRLIRGCDGTGRIEINVTEVELEEVAARRAGLPRPLSRPRGRVGGRVRRCGLGRR
jgi:hypothetical protein